MRSLCVLLAACLGWVARAQTCPPSDEAMFVATAQYYYTDPFTPDTVVSTAGPWVNGITTEATFEVPPPNGYVSLIRRTSSCNGQSSGPSMTFDLVHQMMVRARPEAGTLFGGGIKVAIDVYLKDAPPGTPYVLTQRYSGPVSAEHGSGPGRTDVFYLGNSLGGTTGTYGISVDTATPHSGVTSDRHPPNGDARYFFCETVAVEAGGWVWQSIPFCFPFGCAFANYTANVQLAGSIDVVANPPVCNGKITAPIFTGGCTETAVSGGFWLRYEISRKFEMDVQFTGDCGCCEYRQYVRRRTSFLPPGWAPSLLNPLDPPPNCDGDSTGGPCPVEDTAPRAGCTNDCARYGHRGDDPSCRSSPNLDSYPGPSRLTACSYHGQDSPGYKLTIGYAYIMAVDFMGKVVTTGAPGCGGPERTLAQRRWTVCCSGVAGSGTSGCGSPRTPPPDPRYVDYPISVGASAAWIRFSSSDGYLVAALLIPVASSDAIVLDEDLAMNIGGMDVAYRAPSPMPVVVTSGVSTAIVPRAYRIDGCFPDSVSVGGTYAGQPFAGTFSLLPISPGPRADFDGSGGTPDTTDITAFFVAWLAGDPTADFDRSGGTPDLTDIEAYFAAWLAGC